MFYENDGIIEILRLRLVKEISHLKLRGWNRVRPSAEDSSKADRCAAAFSLRHQLHS